VEQGEEQEDVGRVRVWVSRLQEFISSLGGIDGEKPDDFCENACDAWQGIAMSDLPPKTSPAILIAFEAINALVQVMGTVTMDWATTPDVRDRLTRDAAQQLMKEALDDILRDGERWLSERMPSADQIQQRLTAVAKHIKTAKDANEKQLAEFDADDAEAAADPYGAILGYHEPGHDAAVIFTKVCSFTEDEDKRYRDAHDRLRRMLDSELLQHISDEHKVLCDVLIGILTDLRDDRITLTDEDAIDERRRRLRSALISFTTALQIHQDQTISAAKKTFGRNTPQAQAVQGLFDDLKKASFDYGWLEELRDALQHGDINAFKYNFAARLRGEPAVNVYMDREFMLEFTKQARNKSWLNRRELQAMTSDPSVLDMIKAVRPKMGELQEKLDAILYPNGADDAAVVKELIGRFEGKRGLYALQTGPGFTRRLGIPPFQRLAPRVLAFAHDYAGDGELPAASSERRDDRPQEHRGHD
jgi:hypothetical protein